MEDDISVTHDMEDETSQSPTAESSMAERDLEPGDSAGQPTEATSSQPETPLMTLVENSLALSVNAQQNAVVDNSLVLGLAAGKDMIAIDSLMPMAAVGRDLDIRQGGAMTLVVGSKAQVKNSQIGLLIAKGDVTLENSRVLMTTQQALALGAALGAACALVGRLFRRNR